MPKNLKRRWHRMPTNKLTEQQLYDFGKAWNDSVEGKPLKIITDEELESKYPRLKQLGDKYRKERDKYKNWEILNGKSDYF
jgi:O-phosphoseryl-tRNA(Cys) synthetase